MKSKQFVKEILRQLRIPEAYRATVKNLPFELPLAEERKRPTRFANTRDWFEERRALQGSPRTVSILVSSNSEKFARSRDWLRKRASLAQ